MNRSFALGIFVAALCCALFAGQAVESILLTRTVKVGFLKSVCASVLMGARANAAASSIGDDSFIQTTMTVYDTEAAMVADLANIDVLVVFPSDDLATDFADGDTTGNAIKQFVLNGGGLITGPGLHIFSSAASTGGQAIQDIIPVRLGSSGTSFCEDSGATGYPFLINNSHPIGEGLPSYMELPGSIAWSEQGSNNFLFTGKTNPGSFTIPGQFLSKCDNYDAAKISAQSLIAAEIGTQGRVVWYTHWICASVFQASSSTTIGFGKQILQNSIWWASKVGKACPTCFNGNCVKGPPDFCNCTGGWTGVSCDQFSCPAGFCKHNSVCVGPSQCNCALKANAGLPSALEQSWTGADCNTPLCAGGCQNGGLCQRKNETSDPYCNCSTTTPAPGYIGTRCETPLCTFGSATSSGNECVHGVCISPNVCKCNNDTIQSGQKCNIPQCILPCLNGGTCQNYPDDCNCATATAGPGCWTGRYQRCTLPSCIGACSPADGCHVSNQCTRNATLGGLNYCRCPTGWGGVKCSDPVCTPACENGAPCRVAPGGQYGDPTQCDCAAVSDPPNYAYSGTRCEIYSATTGSTTGEGDPTTGMVFPLVTFTTTGFVQPLPQEVASTGANWMPSLLMLLSSAAITSMAARL